MKKQFRIVKKIYNNKERWIIQYNEPWLDAIGLDIFFDVVGIWDDKTIEYIELSDAEFAMKKYVTEYIAKIVRKHTKKLTKVMKYEVVSTETIDISKIKADVKKQTGD